MKKTRYRLPVELRGGLFFGVNNEDYIGGVVLDLKDAAIASGAGTDSVSWTTMDLEDIAGVTIPGDAIAAILDVAVNDAGASAAEASMAFATPGIIVAGKTQYVYTVGGAADLIGSRIVVVEITGDGKIAYAIAATGATFDYLIKLIGWIVNPGVDPISLPSEDLKATFNVKH